MTPPRYITTPSTPNSLPDPLNAYLEIACVTPREHLRRGSHIALAHPQSAEITRGLLRLGVICDRRPPDVLRFGFNAIYVSFEDVFVAVAAIAETIAELA